MNRINDSSGVSESTPTLPERRRGLTKIARRLDASPLFQLLEYAGRVIVVASVVVAIVVFWLETDSRKTQRHYQAWQVINAAQGKGGSGGRIDALQDLVADGVSLAGVDLSGAWLSGIRLENAELTGARLDSVNLAGANLQNAQLDRASLVGADLSNATVKNASLSGADLSRSTLYQTNLDSTSMMFVTLVGVNAFRTSFREANLAGAFLQNGQFRIADFRKANLFRADVTDACFVQADFRQASFQEIRSWHEIGSMLLANVHGLRNAPEGFLPFVVEGKRAVSTAYDSIYREILGEWAQKEAARAPVDTLPPGIGEIGEEEMSLLLPVEAGDLGVLTLEQDGVFTFRRVQVVCD